MSGGGGIGGGGSSMGSSSSSGPTVEPTASKPTKPRSARAGGMSLKGKKKLYRALEPQLTINWPLYFRLKWLKREPKLFLKMFEVLFFDAKLLFVLVGALQQLYAIFSGVKFDNILVIFPEWVNFHFFRQKIWNRQFCGQACQWRC